MKFLFGIICILIGLFIGLFAKTGLKKYFVGNKEDVERYNSLMKNGKSAIPTFDSVYNETTIVIGGIEATVYEINYEFEVKGEVHNGRYFFENLDSFASEDLKIKYLKENPSVNAINVDYELKKATAALNSKGDLWFGLVVGAFSVFLLVLGAINTVQSLKAVIKTN